MPLTRIEPLTFHLRGGSDSDEQDNLKIHFVIDCKTWFTMINYIKIVIRIQYYIVCFKSFQRPILNGNDYQNLTHLQAAMFGDTPPDSPRGKNFPHLLRPGTELVRRDSGNWSGDRNSASSSSSTSLENPYHYIVGKMQFRWVSEEKTNGLKIIFFQDYSFNIIMQPLETFNTLQIKLALGAWPPT